MLILLKPVRLADCARLKAGDHSLKARLVRIESGRLFLDDFASDLIWRLGKGAALITAFARNTGLAAPPHLAGKA